MSKVDEMFFTTVGCMDGRAQGVVAEYGRKKFGAEYADTITEAGLVGKLAQEQVDQNLLESIRFKVVDVSIGKHHSKGIVVHGHQECAGNLVEDEKHRDDIRKSVQVVKKLANSLVPVVGVFVRRSPTDPSAWEAEELLN